MARDRVIALAFHVDYWNYIGWTDPFSSAAWSERQRAYAATFGTDRVYTPQLVVDGRWEGVGADPEEVERLLEKAAGSPRDEVSLAVTRQGDRVTVRLAAGAAARSRRGWVAVAESGFETPVGRGENAHRKLRNDNVVRRLTPVELAPSGATLSGECVLEVDPEWKAERVRLVAFLQDPVTLHVTGAAQAPLP